MGIRRLLSQWNTKTFGGSNKLSVDDYHVIQDPVHIQEGNLDALQLTNAVGQATNTQSQSGPMPGTGSTYYKAQTSTGSRGALFNPDEGEVWQVGPVSFQLVNNTGAVSVQAWIEADDNTATNRRVLWADASTSSTSYATLHENLSPVFVDANTTVKVEFTGTSDSVNFYLYAIRVR